MFKCQEKFQGTSTLTSCQIEAQLGVAVNCNKLQARLGVFGATQGLRGPGGVAQAHGTGHSSTRRHLSALEPHSASAASNWKDTYADTALNIRSRIKTVKCKSMQCGCLECSPHPRARRVSSNAIWRGLSQVLCIYIYNIVDKHFLHRPASTLWFFTPHKNDRCIMVWQEPRIQL